MKPITKKMRLLVLVLALSVETGSGLIHVSLAGGMPARSGKSRSFLRVPARSAGHVKPVPFSPKRRKFFVVQDRVEQTVSVSVQQTIVAPPTEPQKRAKNMVYIHPRWVETEHGVLVLEPGHWVEPGPGAEY